MKSKIGKQRTKRQESITIALVSVSVPLCLDALPDDDLLPISSGSNPIFFITKDWLF